MENIISIKNIDFKYGEKQIYNDFSLDIEKGSFLTIVGPNGSGKSTLVRILLGLYKTNGSIVINGFEMSSKNISKIIEKVGVVFENPDDQFVAETVMHDIAFTLENMKVPSKEIRKRVKEIAEYLGISDLLEREPHTLSGGEKQMVALASALVINPEILILDEAFTMIDIDTKEKIYKIVQEINKKNNTTIINVTHDTEDILYGNKLLLLNGGKIEAYGDIEDILQEEKTFTKMGLKLPFMADLSIKLKYYGLVDRIIYDMEEMVDILWK